MILEIVDLNSAGFAVFPAEFNRDLLVVATYAQIMTCLLVFTQTRTCSGEYEYSNISVIPVLEITAIMNSGFCMMHSGEISMRHREI